jgi:hypothetical protein
LRCENIGKSNANKIACQAKRCMLERKTQVTQLYLTLYLQNNSISVIVGFDQPGKFLDTDYNRITFFQGKFCCCSIVSTRENVGSPSAAGGGSPSCKQMIFLDITAGGGHHRLARNLRWQAPHAGTIFQSQTKRVGKSVYVSMLITCGTYGRAKRQRISNYYNASTWRSVR